MDLSTNTSISWRKCKSFLLQQTLATTLETLALCALATVVLVVEVVLPCQLHPNFRAELRAPTNQPTLTHYSLNNCESPMIILIVVIIISISQPASLPVTTPSLQY